MADEPPMPGDSRARAGGGTAKVDDGKMRRQHEMLARAFLRLIEGGHSGRVFGICGAQGSGKTTAAKCLRQSLELAGLRVAILSLDDLYLTHEERLDLGATVHPLLATRGPPGTHDVELGLAIVDQLLAGRTTRIPRFDKARDDRRHLTDWDVFAGPADVVLFEGWCVGAEGQADEMLAVPINALERERDPDGVWRRYVNAALAGPYRPLFARIDHLTLFLAPDFNVVTRWRQDQERDLSVACPSADDGAVRTMDDSQLEEFVQHYERLTRHIMAEMPSRADCVVSLGPDREVRSLTSAWRS